MKIWERVPSYSRIEGSAVTANLLPMLGVRPLLGRLFSAAEDREGAAGTLLLSYGLWQAEFGGDAGVDGRRVILDDAPYVVIGVAASRSPRRGRKEFAVRAAMGAGRERLVRQLATESVVLAVLGGAAGVLAALAAVPLPAKLVPNTLPIAGAPSLDFRVLIFVGLLTCATGIGFGTVPALRACGHADLSGLREGARAGGGRRDRLRSAMVIAEVTASVVLLVSAGLLVRALWRIQATDPGFRPGGVLTLRTALPKYEKTAMRQEFYTRVLSAVRALPGVSNAAYLSFLPMVMRGGIWPVPAGGAPDRATSGQGAAYIGCADDDGYRGKRDCLAFGAGARARSFCRHRISAGGGRHSRPALVRGLAPGASSSRRG